MKRAVAAFATTSLLACLYATPALAVPELGLELDRAEVPLHVGDERLAYEVTVENVAGANPAVGDELTCSHPSWSGNPTPTLTYKWLRNGEAIGGEADPTYTVAAEDESKSIQCVVTGTNDPEVVLPGAYAPIANAVASTPIVVEPVPGSAPPSGTTQPTMTGALMASTPQGTATVTKDSKTLTDVVSTEGTGTLTESSTKVTGVTASAGAFEITQVITGIGIPAETRITGLAETGPGVFELTLSKAATASGPGTLSAGAPPFSAGQTISGPGIPPGTKATCATNQFSCSSNLQIIVLENAATASGTKVTITGVAEETCNAPTGWSAGSTITWSFRWLRNGQPIPGATSPTYTVQSEDTESPSRLQCEAIAEDEDGQRAVAISGPKFTSPRPPDPYQFPNGNTPTIDFANQTTGPVTLEMQAPEDPDIHVFKATSSSNKWICAKTSPTATEAATATCTRSDPLSPGEAYETIELVIALGEEPPTTLLTKAKVSGGGSPTSPSAEDQYTIPNPAIPFGFKAFETEVLDEEGNEYALAGGHPFSAGASLEFNTHVKAEAEDVTKTKTVALTGSPKAIATDVPPGFLGNPEVLEELCPSIAAGCPAASVVGSISAKLDVGEFKDSPIYAIEPEAGTPAQFAFKLGDNIFTLSPELRPEDNYAISLVTASLPTVPGLFSADVELCGHGVKLSGVSVAGCRKPGEAGALERSFLSLPTKCGDPASATTVIRAESWEGDKAQAQHTLSSPEGCESLDFEASLKARPTTNNADSPTGLDFQLEIPQSEDPEGRATAHLKKAVVTLPEGLVVNPSGATGLGACTEAQLGMENGVPDNEPVSCPDSSKIGSVSVTTPILDHPLPGSLYVAMPHENPFDSLLALYLVVESPDDGLVIKLAGEVEPDQGTGRLKTTFDQNPQAPVEEVELKVRSGARAPLRTPGACGKHTTTSSLTPWSAPQSGAPISPKDSFQVNRGAGGAPCLSSPPNTPSFEAGTASAIAGIHSPFVLKLQRQDGTQQFSQVTVSPPPGLLGRLAGMSQCPDSALSQAQGKSGEGEQSSPSCPPGSELGSVIAAAGAGPSPFQAQGKAYLAGPYKGAPLSIAIITPAVAGPFDLGTVVVRAAAYVDPSTAQITVRSDPLPQILEGIPLDIRSATVSIDRPDFILNPTSCDPMAVKGELLSTLAQSASLESRFQLAECGRLPFKPKLALKLSGKTKRGDYQGLRATLTAKPGEANIASASVTMPRSAFLAQEHIRTICTRVQFAADSCPKGSIYGRAKAITPLLDQPLTGPVYLRSSDNKLPDLVVALKGPDSLPVEIELAGRTDSKKGALRNTFDLVPDAPVSKFTLELFGGRKGLIVNSRDLCTGTQRASVEMTAQNGKERSFRPVVGNGCGKKGRKDGKRRKRAAR